MNLPNRLTLLRLLISPLFLILYVWHEDFGISLAQLPYLLLFLLTIMELTDTFDGYFARKYNLVTDFGKVIDPMADSISHITFFLSFTHPPIQIPIWVIFLFLYRESVIASLRTICALKGFALAARTSGKIKAVIQAIATYAVVLCLIPFSQGWLTQADLTHIATWIVGSVALFTLFSMFEYIIANAPFIAKSFEKPASQV
ncbi:MAG: CDP-diacylglycerol--glycerol-3-phosphate 3-phosphatidyltransferase [Chlamydiia bacterium]|nr:CDP-diacylglycerol--glycerol-3-phosphate 3-phosphatidyltransferase [Chlamydiia bacterium]